MADEKKPRKEKAEKVEPTPDVKTGAKTEAPAKSDVPKNYSIGEGQKAVTQAYKDNWNAIFGKKKR